MASQYIIDTSGVIKYLNGSLSQNGINFIDDIGYDNSCISFISEIELQVWNPSDEADLHVYQLFAKQAEVIGIDEQVIAETIKIRKSYNLKLPDALIAATALAHDKVLIADNDKDFAKVIGLKYINPNKLGVE